MSNCWPGDTEMQRSVAPREVAVFPVVAMSKPTTVWAAAARSTPRLRVASAPRRRMAPPTRAPRISRCLTLGMAASLASHPLIDGGLGHTARKEDGPDSADVQDVDGQVGVHVQPLVEDGIVAERSEECGPELPDVKHVDRAVVVDVRGPGMVGGGRWTVRRGVGGDGVLL